LQPGVLNTAASHQQDSFSPELDGLLDCPHYTRPQHWAGQAVPEVLMSGNHLDINQWRRQQRLSITLRLRPDLIVRARRGGRLSSEDEAFLLSDTTENAAAATQCR
jgi:tRNA (guanine37-N1)-methyltransferase